MNLKDAEKVWRDSCPDEVDGVVGKRKMPKRWLLKLKLNKKIRRKCNGCRCIYGESIR